MKKLFTMCTQKIYLGIFIPFFWVINPITTAPMGRNLIIMNDTSKMEGRWDITIDVEGKKLPSWLGVHRSGLHTLVGEFVGTGGSARPVSKINFTNGNFSFSILPQWEKEDNDLAVKGILG